MSKSGDTKEVENVNQGERKVKMNRFKRTTWTKTKEIEFRERLIVIRKTFKIKEKII